MTLYADSSFLASLYLPDPKTEIANAFLAKAQTPLAFTSFNRVELRNALRNMVARKEATSATVAKTFPLMESDLNDGLLVEKKLDQAKLLKVAEQLSSRHGEKHVIRCVDLLHVASAHVLGTRVFLTFDRQQAVFARQSGLTVKP
ncbi:MAG: type II toxin-antitoxin system VapC family toxin [Methylacidiphilales bacterium]|nr:type II toxin-antitoxin system VapC family toxin [Candidatus Methylacidiphilales bacterium]